MSAQQHQKASPPRSTCNPVPPRKDEISSGEVSQQAAQSGEAHVDRAGLAGEHQAARGLQELGAEEHLMGAGCRQGRKNQNGEALADVPNPAQHIDAVLVRETHLEDQQIGLNRLERLQ